MWDDQPPRQNPPRSRPPSPLAYVGRLWSAPSLVGRIWQDQEYGFSKKFPGGLRHTAASKAVTTWGVCPGGRLTYQYVTWNVIKVLEGQAATSTSNVPGPLPTTVKCLQLRRTVGRLRQSISFGDVVDDRVGLDHVGVRTIGECEQLPQRNGEWPLPISHSSTNQR